MRMYAIVNKTLSECKISLEYHNKISMNDKLKQYIYGIYIRK